MNQLKSYKVLFYLLLLSNLTILLLIFLNKSRIIPLYKRATRIYVSLMQSKVYRNELPSKDSKLLESSKKTDYLKGNIGNNKLIQKIKDNKIFSLLISISTQFYHLYLQ